MCCFNSSKFLERAIESVLNQTYQEFELLIVDANSTDTTYSILQKYSKIDKRIKIFKREKQYSWYSNSIYVLDKASGTNFMWLDPDDCISKTWLENGAIELGKNSVVAMGTIAMLDDRNQVILNHAASFNRFKFYEYSSSMKRICAALLVPENLGHMNSLYAIYQTNFLRNTISWKSDSQNLEEDIIFELLILHKSKISLISSDAILYRHCLIESDNYIFGILNLDVKPDYYHKSKLSYFRYFLNSNPPIDSFNVFLEKSEISKLLPRVILGLRSRVYKIFSLLRFVEKQFR